MDAYFVSTLIGAGVVLLGIWLKARIEFAIDRKTVAAVVYAELSESMRQLQYFAAIVGVVSKYVDKERAKEFREEIAKSGFEGDPTIKRTLERYARQIKLLLDLSKDFGPKTILHTGPMSLGKLGPHLAYLTRSLYARVDAAIFPVAVRATDVEGLFEFLASFDDFEREVKAATDIWNRANPLLLRAAGIQAS